MDGVLVVDKPVGLTSHDAVSVVRRTLGERRVGHTGTLDPMATGVLPMACGKATRLVRFLSGATKDYTATIRFGLTTDTYDVTGRETGRSTVVPTREDVERAVAQLTGEYAQVPPAFSAKKVEGRRAYVAARAGEAVALAAVPVHVFRAEVTQWQPDGDVTVELTSSSGFYVRSFAHEAGAITGTGACLAALRRTRSGEFHLDQSVALHELQARTGRDRLLPLRALLPHVAGVRLGGSGLQRAIHGREIPAQDYEDSGTAPTSPRRFEPGGDGAEWVRLFDEAGDLVGMAVRGAGGALHPRVVLI